MAGIPGVPGDLPPLNLDLSSRATAGDAFSRSGNITLGKLNFNPGSPLPGGNSMMWLGLGAAAAGFGVWYFMGRKGKGRK